MASKGAPTLSNFANRNLSMGNRFGKLRRTMSRSMGMRPQHLSLAHLSTLNKEGLLQVHPEQLKIKNLNTHKKRNAIFPNRERRKILEALLYRKMKGNRANESHANNISKSRARFEKNKSKSKAKKNYSSKNSVISENDLQKRLNMLTLKNRLSKLNE
jgi:hypothetical protein